MHHMEAHFYMWEPSLASQTHFREKKGRVWWTVYTSYVPLHYRVWSNHVEVFCHMTHYITVWVATAVFTKIERELERFFLYCMSCKNTLTVLLRERAYSVPDNSRVHYLKSDYFIHLIAFWWDTACICSSSDPFLFCGSGFGLRH